MCGRFYTDFDDAQYREMLAMLYIRGQQDEGLLMIKNGEVFPTDLAAALDAGGPRVMRWGFARFDGKGVIINARSETVLEKSMFRAPMLSAQRQSGRCLIPANAYFEWETRDKTKIKYRLRPAHEGMFTFAGLYRSEAGAKTPVFTIITAPAADGISFIHDRMPLILPKERREAWLNDPDEASRLLQEGAREIEYEPAV
jgi:putative SOS response-associated peptidase YedK